MKKTVFYAFAAALALVSCAKEQAPVVSNEVVTRIYAAMDPVKSTVGIDGTTVHFSWTSGEVISVATAEGFTDFTCTNTSTGEFTHAGEVTPLNVAVSPAQTTDKFTSETNFKVGLPAVYTYVEGKTNALMIGTKGEGDKYIFGHAAALLSITYENLPEGTKGISVTADKNISGSNIELSGTSASAIEIKNDNAGLSEKTVSISHDATVGNTASRTYYIPLPTGTYEELTFHLIHENDAIETSTTKTVKNVTLERGNYAALPAATLAEGFAPYTVGAKDNTSGFFVEKSASYAIPAGKVLHLEFTNYGSGAGTWNNWNIAVTKKPFGETGYAEYFVLRADNYGWTPKTNFNDTPSLRDDLTWTGNWDTFITDMNGAQVTMTIEHTTEGGMLLNAVSVGKNTYTETYKFPVSVSEDIFAFLFTDGSHFQINKVWYSNSKKVLDHIASAYDYYLYDEALDLAVVGAPNGIRAVYTDGSDAPADASLYGGATGTLNAVAGEQVFSSTFKGSAIDLHIPVKLGNSAFGSTTLATSGLIYSPFFGDVPAGETVSKSLFVYSSCLNNYASPCADIASAGFTSFYASFRMDNYGWGTNYGSATPTSNWNWEVFQAMQNHDTVKISWTNDTTTATVRFDATYWYGETHFQQYAGCTISNGELAYRCFTENSYVVAID